MAERIDIHREDGKVIGHVDGSVFYKTLTEKEHMLEKPPGWACDIVALHAAKQAGATHLTITATDTGRTYTASIESILRWGRFIARHHGDQLVLVLSRWTIVDPNQPRLI